MSILLCRGVLVVASLAISSFAFGQAPVPPTVPPGPLPLLPADNWWNVDISGAPVDSLSTNFINFIGATDVVHPDFGGDADPFPSIYGMTYVVVPGSTPLQQVNFGEFGYPDESDVGAPGRPPGYPIPDAAKTQPRWLEGGQPATCAIDAPGCDGDRHLLLVDQDNRLLFELYQLFWTGSQWQAGSGAVFSLDSNQRRPEGWTSADAAGLAILPGLVRYDEVFGPNPIRHAFRMTVRDTNGYVFPASHVAGNNPAALPMGARLRLKASTPMPANAQLQKVFQAMKTYGLIVADNGSDMYVTGTYDNRWDSPLIGNRWGTITASDFEVVQLGWKPPSLPALDLRFYTLSPCRLVDTRGAVGVPYGGPALSSGVERIFTATGQCAIPTTARAISINAAVVNAPGPGNLRFFPGDASAPTSSNVNFTAGQTRANNAVVKLGALGGNFAVRQDNTVAAATHLIVDVNGYFQ